jgi:hypothetical protein
MNLLNIDTIMKHLINRAYFLVVLAVLFVACGSNANDPDAPQQLIGTWSEAYHVNTHVSVLTFQKDGVLRYSQQPDTTWPVVPTGGFSMTLHYSADKKNQLLVTYSPDTATAFEYLSGYSIHSNTLTIDSFSYDGVNFYKPLILQKTE